MPKTPPQEAARPYWMPLSILIVVALLSGTGCTSENQQETPRNESEQIGQESVPPKQSDRGSALKQFEDDNFGMRFSHTSAISTTYNPHGSANQVALSWKGKPLGMLKVGRLPPPTVSVDDFIAAGKEYYRKKYDTSRVEYKLYRVRKGYDWHRITVKTTMNDTEYVIDKFVYLHKPENTDSAELSLEMLFGSFAFDFLIAKNDYESVIPDIQILVNSFTISETD